VNHFQTRLRTIEVKLTPSQVVLLWIKSAIRGTYEEGAFRPVLPRTVIANSIASILRSALKGEPEAVIDRGILQGRQEADTLFCLMVEVNAQVHRQSLESDREFTFLLGYFSRTMGSDVRSISEKQVRALTLFFVTPILVLQGAICRISTAQFAGQPILFSDSAARLQEQMDSVDGAFAIFNSIAERTEFGKLSKEQISESLSAEIDQKTSDLLTLARGTMLGAFGEPTDLRDHFRRVVAARSLVEVQDDKK